MQVSLVRIPTNCMLLLYYSGFPWLPIIAYSIVKVLQADTKCWINNVGAWEWIIYVPNLLSLIVSILTMKPLLILGCFGTYWFPQINSGFLHHKVVTLLFSIKRVCRSKLLNVQLHQYHYHLVQHFSFLNLY